MAETASIDEKRLRRTLRRLVDIYSPSGKEQEVVTAAYRQLRKAGLPVERIAVDEDRDNLWVPPPEGSPRVVLVGHLDTVSAYDLECFESRERADEISGLGTADMKGGCAAMIEAFLTLAATGLDQPPAGLALVVGEEEAGDGIEALLGEVDFEWALVGEPTALEPCLGSYSYLEAVLTSAGRRAHASLGNPEDNAIQMLLRVLIELTDHLDRHPSGLHYNVRDMESAKGGFASPEQCEAWLDLHLPPDAPTGAIATELSELVSGAADRFAAHAVRMRYSTIHEGYELPDRGRLPRALRAAHDRLGLAWSCSSFRSHSDANVLWAAGVRPVVLGPGRLEAAHSRDEAVSFAEVAQAARIYLATLLELGASS